MNSFYITTPIFYVNARPHLGHAYTTIAADAVTRMHKMMGDETLFVTGTDEHGEKIVQAAEKNHATPEQFVDEISSQFRKLWPDLAISEHAFIRTTAIGHQKAVKDLLQKLYDRGDIYFGEFGGYYCYGCERFYTDKELENGLCPQHLSKPEFISEKNYFFRMSSYLPWLREFLLQNPDLIRPERYYRETLGMLDSGALEDLCISRPKSRLEWGIELPFDKNYVCYVWFDALLCYLTGIGWPGSEEFKRFWPGTHLIAKDILKPHAIFWPCMLKAADLPIYRHLEVHGYWLSRETKMSKSLGNVIDPLEMSQKFGLDAFRYFLLREMRFGSDANFGEELLIERINADLANDLGNLFSRTLAMVGKYFNGSISACEAPNVADNGLIEQGLNAMQNYAQLFLNMEFSLALENLWSFIGALNKYVDASAPWRLFKEQKQERLKTVMSVLTESLQKIALCLWPVMPDASLAMLRQLGWNPEAGRDAPPVVNLNEIINVFAFENAGRKMAASSNLFPRIEAPEKSEGNQKKAEAPASANYADIKDFNALEIRAGQIISAAKVEGADRLLALQIDFGSFGKRQILSGIAEYYAPESLAGKKVCAILNLKPRKIRGELSHGMALTVESGDVVKLLEPPNYAANGSKIC